MTRTIPFFLLKLKEYGWCVHVCAGMVHTTRYCIPYQVPPNVYVCVHVQTEPTFRLPPHLLSSQAEAQRSCYNQTPDDPRSARNLHNNSLKTFPSILWYSTYSKRCSFSFLTGRIKRVIVTLDAEHAFASPNYRRDLLSEGVHGHVGKPALAVVRNDYQKKLVRMLQKESMYKKIGSLVCILLEE